METKNLNVQMNSVQLEQAAIKMDTVNQRIESIFNNIDIIMSNINNNDNWKGDTNKEYYNRYLELKEYFPKIVKGIETYSKFLKVTSSNYDSAENQINNNIETNLDNLNIN